MAVIALSFLGPGTIEIDGAAAAPRSLKTLGLLCYLVLEHDRPHGRAGLAALFWPDLEVSGARHNLRQSLHWLRQVGNAAMRDRIEVSNDLVRWGGGNDPSIDLHRFLAGVRSHRPDSWRDAASAWRAPLLDGRRFDACEAFDEWLAATRLSLAALDAQNRLRLGIDARGFGLSRSLAPIASQPAAVSRAAKPSQAGKSGLPWSGQTEQHDSGAVVPLLDAARAAAKVHAFGHALDLIDRALARDALRRDALNSADARNSAACGASGGGAGAIDPAVQSQCRLDILLLKEAMLDRLGRRAEQWAVIAQARDCAVLLDDAAAMAPLLLRLASACAYGGRFDEGLRHARAALAVFRAACDRPGEAEALRELGFLCWRADDCVAALDHSREALAVHRSLGDVAGEASALHNLAEIQRGLGSARQALQGFARALELHWSVKNGVGEILSLFGSAGAWKQLGDDSMAERQFRAALQTCERHGERTMQARALQALARHRATPCPPMCATAHAIDEAVQLMRQALAIDRSINYAHALGHDLLDLAALQLMRGERIEARAALGEATVWFDSVGDSMALAEVRSLLTGFDAAGQAPRAETLRSSWVRSHLPLAEGKVYCAFESPLARERTTLRPISSDRL